MKMRPTLCIVRGGEEMDTYLWNVPRYVSKVGTKYSKQNDQERLAIKRAGE